MHEREDGLIRMYSFLHKPRPSPQRSRPIGLVLALKVACMSKIFGAQSCLMVAFSSFTE